MVEAALHGLCCGAKGGETREEVATNRFYADVIFGCCNGIIADYILQRRRRGLHEGQCHVRVARRGHRLQGGGHVQDQLRLQGKRSDLGVDDSTRRRMTSTRTARMRMKQLG